MELDVSDTIAAIASAPGGGLRGIVRMSGPDAVRVVATVFVPQSAQDLHCLRQPTRLEGYWRLPAPLGEVPCSVYVWPTLRSYTRQPSVEIHTYGSPPILQAILASLCAAGARVAGPGEFTLRAFLAGRLDLTQAEAVLGVIDAEGEEQLRVALAQLAGGLAAPLHELRERLLELLAHLEAGLDFVEEDIEFITADELAAQLESLARQIYDLAAQMETRDAHQGEYRVVLYGCPNVGKSSLLNALAGEAAAIVSDTAGTTRDYVTCQVEIGGLDCQLIDTAGQGGAQHAIDTAAEASGLEQAARAHLAVLCLDLTRDLSAWERQELEQHNAARLVVLTKADLVGSAAYPTLPSNTHAIAVSNTTHRGLAELRLAIVHRLESLATTETRCVAGTAARCHDSLRLAGEAVERARQIAMASHGEELVAAELRVALDELGRVVGAVYTDDVLDRIFSRFCIGK